MEERMTGIRSISMHFELSSRRSRGGGGEAVGVFERCSILLARTRKRGDPALNIREKDELTYFSVHILPMEAMVH